MVIPAQEQEFKASLGYVKLCLKRLKARGYSVVNPSTHVRWLTWTLTPAPGRWTSTGPALIDTPHHNTHIGGGGQHKAPLCNSPGYPRTVDQAGLELREIPLHLP